MEGYLVFVLGCLGIEFISVVALLNKLKSKGYKYNFKKKSFSENFCNWLKVILKNCIPVYNIVLVISLLIAATNEEVEQKVIEDLDEKGLISKTEEQLDKEEAERLAKLEENEIRESLDTIDEAIENKYSAMSNDEKLAFLKKERDSILGAGKVEEPVIQKVKENNNKNFN